MFQDPIIEAVDRVETARLALADALAVLGKALARERQARATSVALSQIAEIPLVGGGPPPARVEVDCAIAAYQAAMLQLRSTVVRSLVDERGMTLTAVAGLLGRSRQRTATLYNAVRGSPRPATDGEPWVESL